VPLELGAQWIGDTHHRMEALAAELGAGIYPQFEDGETSYEFAGEVLREQARSRPRTTRLTSPCARMVLTAGVPGLSVMAVGRHRSDGRERGGLGRVAGWNHAHYCLWHRANRERADGWPDRHGDERRHGRNLGGERNKVLP
jgi:hypothetical protein